MLIRSNIEETHAAVGMLTPQAPIIRAFLIEHVEAVPED